ncbi:DUF2785 domain-containing protein [Streptococcus cuniculipharyngis]|uniref:DUF2785 domain-containing protein n=1 Tax=Streptococcus cuniculipharyngis TaxID=1562651 RepID=A0A5C5S943_9STRE|nr:DUF2785 domain-containing protein [Streptococcus cuniculipharyngis]TWS96473.1 DUF2785 domain-containing protein [Streptococcus cuniculipharyngis]
METRLQEKLHLEDSYSDEEISWLLEHIGDKNPKIRDNLVYASFCQAILGERISRSQFQCLTRKLLEEQYLFYRIEELGEATLTRSFTALVLALVLSEDSRERSSFYNGLSAEERMLLFQAIPTYLARERDTTGYHRDYGWVHAFAHGADLLMFASQHVAFPREMYQDIWTCLV